MRRLAAYVLLAISLLASGCASSAPEPAVEPAVTTAVGVESFVFDPPADATEYSQASLEASAAFPRLAASEYAYPDDLSAGFPASPDEFLERARAKVVQVHSYADETSSTIFDSTGPGSRDYLLLVELPEGIVGSCDWCDEGAGYFSFYEEFGTLDVSRALSELSAFFGDRQVAIRFVHVPRGYWVVGRASGQERAAFVAHQGEFEDDPAWDRLYTADEVLAYGTPHGDSR